LKDTSLSWEGLRTSVMLFSINTVRLYFKNPEFLNDSTFDTEIQKRLNALYPQAKKHLILDVGHTPAIKKGEEFLSLINQFFDED